MLHFSGYCTAPSASCAMATGGRKYKQGDGRLQVKQKCHLDNGLLLERLGGGHDLYLKAPLSIIIAFKAIKKKKQLCQQTMNKCGLFLLNFPQVSANLFLTKKKIKKIKK